jgi:hypothetical protein
MGTEPLAPWIALGLLGAFHGLNPAMGWLFAVALGFQEGQRAAVYRALVPISLGHAASIAIVVAAAGVARLVVPPTGLALGAAVALLTFGGYRLWRGMRHRRGVGMRASFGDLAVWSFLAATAHGAGLMIVPALLALPGPQEAHVGHHHLALAAVGGTAGYAAAAVAVHTLAMLLVSGGIAVLVFDRLGLAFLRRAWVNVDTLWALALVLAGGFFLVAAASGGV